MTKVTNPMAFNARSNSSRISVAIEPQKTHYFTKLKSLSYRLERKCRYLYLRFGRLRGTRAEIARGLALGVFAGSFPVFGLQIIIGVILAIIFRGNKLAAAAGTWVSNPLTYVPIFAFNYKVGELLLGRTESLPSEKIWQSWPVLMDSGLEFIMVLFFGCFVVGCIASVCTYLMSLRMLSRWHELRQARKK